jgi:monoamine oxidase
MYKNSELELYDVAIVGAGAAGIIAAEVLVKKGLKVCVLEARDRIGGRLKSVKTNSGVFVELGGQWLAMSGQKRLEALVKRYKYEHFINTTKGYVFSEDLNGLQKLPKGSIPLSFVGKIDSLRFKYYISKKIRDVNLGNIQKNKGLDQIDIQSWLNNNLWTKDSREYWRILFEQALCCEISNVSVLEGLLNLSSIGGLDKLENADHFYFSYGLSNLFSKIVKDNYIEVRYNSEITHINQDQDSVTLRGSFGEIKSKFALVAVPPQVFSQISFEPKLSEDLDKVIHSFQQGNVVKVVAVYDKSWWRDMGNSGLIQSQVGPFDFIIDSSFPNLQEGVLVGLAVSTYAKKLENLSDSEIKEKFIEQVNRIHRASYQPTEIHCMNWNKEYHSLGGFSSRRKIGDWSLFEDILTLPEGRVYFAGTESAREWRGYIEGALESGERQADIISTKLK